MKKLRIGLIAAAVGLFAISCNTNTDSETTNTDTLNMMESASGGLAPMDTMHMGTSMDTVGTSTTTPPDNTGDGMPEGNR